MILDGNQRGGARDLARHLMKAENEHVEVQEIRGFMADTILGALREAEAISRGTKCRQFLYSLSLSPPETESVPVAAFDDAIERIEAKLGLVGHPRIVVFHEKHGRRHAHCVWSRITGQHGKLRGQNEAEAAACAARDAAEKQGLIDRQLQERRTLQEEIRCERRQHLREMTWLTRDLRDRSTHQPARSPDDPPRRRPRHDHQR